VEFAAGRALAVNPALAWSLCKEKNSCTPGVQESGSYLLGEMPTLTRAGPVACFENVEGMLSPGGSRMLSLANSRSSLGKSTGLPLNNVNSHNGQREGHFLGELLYVEKWTFCSTAAGRKFLSVPAGGEKPPPN